MGYFPSVTAFAEPQRVAGLPSKLLPSKIVLGGGQTYNAPKLLRVEPDGLIIEYLLDSGATGLTKLKLGKLPETLQKQFGYDKAQASAYEADQAFVTAEFSRNHQHDELIESITRDAMARVQAVFVEAASPTVEYTYYDPAGPIPPQVPKGMVGCADREFKCWIKNNSDVSFQSIQRSNDGPFFRLETVKISLELPITITLPKNPYAKLRAHEEGHRKIYEHFYGLGARAAQRAGELMIGKEFPIFSKDAESAKGMARTAARRLLELEYFKYTKDPAHEASKYYDEITDHGRNQTDTDQAVRESIERFELQLPD